MNHQGWWNKKKKKSLCFLSQKEEKKRKKWRGKRGDGVDEYKRLCLSIGWAFWKGDPSREGRVRMKEGAKNSQVSLKTSCRERRNHLCSLGKDWQKQEVCVCGAEWEEVCLQSMSIVSSHTASCQCVRVLLLYFLCQVLNALRDLKYVEKCPPLPSVQELSQNI